MTDDGGVLGNLPNSRPGKRSAKRDRPAKAAEKAAVKAEASGKPAARPARTSKAKRTRAVKAGGIEDGVGVLHDMDAKRRHDPPNPPEAPGDPVGAVVRGAAGLAATGVKVAGAVTQELLRRLPRP
jgi:hypothetical protein